MEAFSDSLLQEALGRNRYGQFRRRGYVSLRKYADLTREELEKMGVINYFEQEWLLDTFTKRKGEEEVVRELLVSISHTELSPTSTSTLPAPPDQ